MIARARRLTVPGKLIRKREFSGTRRTERGLPFLRSPDQPIHLLAVYEATNAPIALF